MGFILFFIAVILVGTLFIVSVLVEVVFNIVTFKWKTGLKESDVFFERMAVSLDMFGNVSCRRFLQLTMTKKGLVKFGEYGQTVSYILGMSALSNDLTLFGRFIVWILDKLDKDHCNKAIESQRVQDLKAIERLNAND